MFKLNYKKKRRKKYWSDIYCNQLRTAKVTVLISVENYENVELQQTLFQFLMQLRREAVKGKAKDDQGPSGERRRVVADPGPSTSGVQPRRNKPRAHVAKNKDDDENGDDDQTQDEGEAPPKKLAQKRKGQETKRGGKKSRGSPKKRGGNRGGNPKKDKAKKGPSKGREEDEESMTSASTSNEDDDNYEPRRFRNTVSGKLVK